MMKKRSDRERTKGEKRRKESCWAAKFLEKQTFFTDRASL